MRESTVVKLIEIENRMVVARGWAGGEKRELSLYQAQDVQKQEGR